MPKKKSTKKKQAKTDSDFEEEVILVKKTTKTKRKKGEVTETKAISKRRKKVETKTETPAEPDLEVSELESNKMLKLSKIRIGYPCQNWTLKLTTSHTFRMNSFSPEKLKTTVQSNIDDLLKMLDYNKKNNIGFLRIGSGFVPFASHEKYRDKFDWVSHFRNEFAQVGKFIKENNMRISMHPDQFVLINSPKEDIQQRSVWELLYHCQLLNAMELDHTHKVQIHVGGVYDNKPQAIERFIDRYNNLDQTIRDRLVIENDDRLYSLKDCLEIHNKTGIPILFDNLHHECLNNGEPLKEAMEAAHKTWKEKDGVPLMDYSSQEKGARKGKHASTLSVRHFNEYIKSLDGVASDIMLEIKDKESSALKAMEIMNK